MTRSCAVSGCPRPYLCKGLCRLHWERQHRTGTTDAPPPNSRERNAAWKGAGAGYKAVHQRMSTGPRPSACESCGTSEGRMEWALKPDAPESDLLVSPEGWRYSTDPAHYDNLCKTCHNKRDLGRDRCREGHLVAGDNAYTYRTTGKKSCRTCIRRRRRERSVREALARKEVAK